jgi:homoserine kinase
VLPANYTSADVIANIQAVSILGLAFAQGRGDLLRVAMQDRIHQPYRAAICPLLTCLLPLAGSSGILGVSLSGAGPAVLVIVEGDAEIAVASKAILGATRNLGFSRLLSCSFEENGAIRFLGPE